MPRPPETASPFAWLERVEFGAPTFRFGAVDPIALLSRPLTYATAPARGAGSTVVAMVTDPLARKPRSLRVELFPLAEGYGISGRCACTSWGVCAHVYSFLLDLAVAPPLRRALIDGDEDTTPLLASLPALRAAARERLAAERVVTQWFGLETRAAPAPVEFSITVFDGFGAPASGRGGARHYGYDATDATTRVELRARIAGERALIDPRAEATHRLRPEDRRVLDECEPMTRSRKGFEAAGLAAGLVVHLLRGRDDVLVEGTTHRVKWSDATVALHIERARLSRDLLAVYAQRGAALSMYYAADEHGYVPRFLRDDELADPVAPAGGGRRGARGARVGEQVDALEARWRTRDGALDVPAREAVYLPGAYPYLWVPAQHTFYPVDPAVDPVVATGAQVRPAVELPAEQAPHVYRQLRRVMRGRAVELPPPEAMGVAPAERAEFTLRIDGAALDVRARLAVAYGGETVALAPGAVPADDGGVRDTDAEEAALARVTSAGLRWDPGAGAFTARDDAAVRFWLEGVRALESGNASGAAPHVTLAIPDALRKLTVRPPLRGRLRVSLVGGLLDASVGFESEGAAAELAALRAALEAKRRWVVLDDGSLAEITAQVAELASDVIETVPDAGRAKLSPHQLGRIDRWAEACEAGASIDASVETFRSRLRALAVNPAPEMPRSLRAELRPYQRAGLAWLQFLHALGAGGVLADDMGLGKTVTALALLLWRRERDGRAPSLVVCPTSVAGNWVREAARFAPDLRVVLLHGAGRRDREAEVPDADVVITTYALLRMDVDTLASRRFRYVILDEAQNIKNVEAATTHAARRLDTEGRLALTGTPVENRLSELWSIMDFCNPGMLGTHREFQSRYERPIIDDPKGPEARRLRALVRPLVLRRTKGEVLTDLPPKEEIDRACVMRPSQRTMYDALASLARRDVQARIERDGLGRSGLAVLTALLRLRQVACDPRLVDATRGANTSAKREVFLELVRALVAEGRRALVFSQFVELLTLWRKDLDRERIAYEYLDGSTRDRDAVVARFQQGAAPLFLISLRAGGTGLNLTAADTVIHIDPWWNPAVEDQATDRAHRIGQDKPVTVYRLVARGTVEDKIMLLKARKKELADAVIRDDAGALRGLSEDDVRLLLGDAEDVLDESEAVDGADEASASAGGADAADAAEGERKSERPAKSAAGAESAAGVRAPRATKIARRRVGDEVVEVEEVGGADLEEARRRVTAWLKRTGATQGELGTRVGTAQVVISQIVLGKRRSIPRDVWERIMALEEK